MKTAKLVILFTLFFFAIIQHSIKCEVEITTETKINDFSMDSLERDKILACGELVHKRFQTDNVNINSLFIKKRQN